MATVAFIDEARFTGLVAPLIGLQISRVWFGDFTALYLEVGPLTGAYPKSGRLKAEHTVFLGFDWVLESAAVHEVSSIDVEAATLVGNILTGDKLAEVSVSPSKEIVLTLVSRRRIRSAARVPDKPEWTVHLPSGLCIGVEARSLVLQP